MKDNAWNERLHKVGYGIFPQMGDADAGPRNGLLDAARAVVFDSVFVVDAGGDGPGEGATAFEIGLHPALERPTVRVTFTEAEVNAIASDDALHAAFVQRVGEAIITALKG